MRAKLSDLVDTRELVRGGDSLTNGSWPKISKEPLKPPTTRYKSGGDELGQMAQQPPPPEMGREVVENHT